jgi:8-oxo-dGTP pyrophosphatase MutT (NUDIX family)
MLSSISHAQDMERNPWKTLGSNEKYDNPWIRVVEHQVIKPSGTKGIYGTVHFKNLAIGILPVAENGDTWLVGQWRYPLGAYSWELPEGGGPMGTPPLDSAKRELKEETGLVARDWQLILEMDLSNSATDEKAYGYLAQGITEGKSHPEEEEDLVVRRVPLKEVLEDVLGGKIRDALTVALVLRAARILGI